MSNSRSTDNRQSISPSHRPRSGYNPDRTSENIEGKTLYFANIPHNFRDDDLEELCSKYGTLCEHRVITHPISKISRGFGFASFESVKGADAALKALNGKDIDGKCIKVEKAKRNRPHDPTPGHYRGPPSTSYYANNPRYDRRVGKFNYFNSYDHHHMGDHSPYTSMNYDDNYRMYNRKSRDMRNYDISNRYEVRENRGYQRYDSYDRDRYGGRYRNRSPRYYDDYSSYRNDRGLDDREYSTKESGRRYRNDSRYRSSSRERTRYHMDRSPSKGHGSSRQMKRIP